MKKINLFSLLLSVIVSLSGFVFYFYLPNTIPIHWNFQGEIDNYAGRGFIMLLASLPLLIFVLMHVLAKVDPKRSNDDGQTGPFEWLCLVLVVMMSALYALTLAASFQLPVNVAMFTPMLVGLMMVFVGWLLPKLKPSFFVGIRTPWTLSSDDVWIKTHRMGGWVFVLCGLLFILTGLVGNLALTNASFVVLLLGILFLTIYSYVIFRKQ